MRFCLPQCESDARSVIVSYKGMRDGVHRFRVSSISRGYVEHLVLVKITDKFNKMPKSAMTPSMILEDGLVRTWSSDEWFKYGGCAYYHTQLGCSIYPEFRSPKDPNHDCLASHTELAVLELLCNMGPGVLKANFSAIGEWDDTEGCYKFRSSGI